MQHLNDLTNEELYAFYIIESDPEQKEFLRNDFFIKNTKLTHYVATKFQNTGVPFDELAAIAAVGMVKAFNTFKLRSEYKFATYAIRVMYNEILIYLRKVKRQRMLSTFSIDEPVPGAKDDKEMSFYDIIPDDSHFEKNHAQSEMVTQILEIAKQILNDKEYAVFINQVQDAPLTQRDLQEELNVSQSYVSRLTERANRKIKQHLETRGWDIRHLLPN